MNISHTSRQLGDSGTKFEVNNLCLHFHSNFIIITSSFNFPHDKSVGPVTVLTNAALPRSTACVPNATNSITVRTTSADTTRNSLRVLQGTLLALESHIFQCCTSRYSVRFENALQYLSLHTAS